jgi:hypothetical protein
MPGAAASVPSAQIAAGTENRILLRAGTHQITRVGDLRYQPLGLSYGQTSTGRNGIYREDDGNGQQSWVTSDYDTLNYFGTFSTTGSVSFNLGPYDNDRGFAVWNVPTNVTWDLLDYGHADSNIGGSGCDILINNTAMLDGSSDVIKELRTESGSFFAASSPATGGSNRQLLAYMASLGGGDEFYGWAPGTFLFQNCLPGSSLHVATTDNLGTGDSITNFWILVQEKPTSQAVVTVNIPGKIPLVGGDGLTFSVKEPTIITWSSDQSGNYNVSQTY